MDSRRSSSVRHSAHTTSQRGTEAAAPGGVAESPRRPDLVARKNLALGTGLAVAVAFLALYVATAARSIVVGDNPELMEAAVLLGVAHPSGYPLLVLIGHMFGLLPFGPVAFR